MRSLKPSVQVNSHTLLVSAFAPNVQLKACMLHAWDMLAFILILSLSNA